MIHDAIHEPCPPGLEIEDFPGYGGMLCFNEPEDLVAHCPICDWKGMPTIRNGIISSHCPYCRPMRQTPYAMPFLTDDFLPIVVARNLPCPCGSGLKAKKCPCDEYSV